MPDNWSHEFGKAVKDADAAISEPKNTDIVIKPMPVSAPSNLTNCPDCTREISKNAANCPHCGRPMKAIIIEATNKRFKRNKLISVSLLLLGILIMFIAMVNMSKFGIVTGVLVTTFGIVLYVFSRFGAWWHHG